MHIDMKVIGLTQFFDNPGHPTKNIVICQMFFDTATRDNAVGSKAKALGFSVNALHGLETTDLDRGKKSALLERSKTLKKDLTLLRNYGMI